MKGDAIKSSIFKCHFKPESKLIEQKYWCRDTVAWLLIAVCLGTCPVSRSHAVESKNSGTTIPGSTADKLVSDLNKLQSQISTQALQLSLQQAITLGIQNNPQLASTYRTIQQYEWQLIAARRQWYPNIVLNNGSPFAGRTLQNYSSDIFSSTTPNQIVSYSDSKISDFLSTGVSFNWNFFSPTRQPDINAAVQALRQQKFLFDVSAHTLILQIQESYFRVQAAQQLITNFQQIYAINKKQLEATVAQRKIGMSTVLDVELTRSQLFLQLSQLEQYTRRYIQDSAKLSYLIGLGNNRLAVPSEPATMTGTWTLGLEETINKAVTTREEIRASLAAAESARWTGLSAIRSYLPSFQLVGVVNAARYSNKFFTDTTTSSTGLGFTWSIFDGGIQAANAQAAFAEQKQQEELAANTILQVTQQVRSDYGNYQTAQVAVASAKNALESAKKAHAASAIRFSIGIGDITSVVQTIQQLSQATELLSESVYGYNLSVAGLFRATSTWPLTTYDDVKALERRLRSGLPTVQSTNSVVR